MDITKNKKNFWYYNFKRCLWTYNGFEKMITVMAQNLENGWIIYIGFGP